MIHPLYNSACSLVGWIDRAGYIFDPDMNWVAYIDRNNGWACGTNEWLGPVNGTICMDRGGRVVSWSVGQKLLGDPFNHRRPPTPRKPSPPQSYLRPMLSTPPLPAAPLGGWSPLTFEQWINQTS